MTLARLGPRNCLIWRNLGRRFGTTTGEELWAAFYRCLEDLRPEGTTMSWQTEARIRDFLKELVAHRVLLLSAETIQDFEAEIEESSTVAEILGQWQTNAVVNQLFDGPIDRAAAFFYLSQMAYVLGFLRIAKAFAIDAYKVLPLANNEKPGKALPRALTILEFLVLSLVIEINFLAEGRSAKVEDGLKGLLEPHVRLEESLKGLLPRKERFARDFIEAADHNLLRNLALEDAEEPSGIELTEPVRALVREIRAEILDQIPQESPITDSREHEHLPLAFELSRKNLGGMVLFRLRQFQEAEEAFEWVLEQVANRREADKGQSVLQPLELEARVHLGRLAAQRCNFKEGEHALDNAVRGFEEMGDAFAANKARRYLAEVKYRQLAWTEAEKNFIEVQRTSERLRFDHDTAVAEMFLGKIYSRFGFQEWAVALFESAHDQFGSVGIPREYIDSLFWQAAAQARYLDIDGHPAENVINVGAILKTYRRLFEKINDENLPDLVAEDAISQEYVESLRKSTFYERHPDLLEAMMKLRLGSLPTEDALERLVGLARREGGPKAGWNGEAHAHLCRQLVRLVLLQKTRLEDAEEWATAEPTTSAAELRKYVVRDTFIGALAATLEAPWNPVVICLRIQETYKLREKLDLKGGFVPSLVDISQFFADRNCYVAMLLLLESAISEGVRHSALNPVSELDVEILKDVYRSITKYLVLERNLYLGAPPFTPVTNTPELWQRLEEIKPHTDSWQNIYTLTLRGGYGLSYPSHAAALGWVESFDQGSATLALVWLDEQHGKPLTEDSFTSLEVPLDVIRDGHAEENLAPVLLVGRMEPQKKETGGDWVAHRLPSLAKGKLFERDPFGQPKLAIWQAIFSRLVGDVPTVCQTPQVAEEEIETQYRYFARKWFHKQLPAPLFRFIFFDLGDQSDLGPELDDDNEIDGPGLAANLDPIRDLLQGAPSREEAIQVAYRQLESAGVAYQPARVIDHLIEHGVLAA